MPILLHKMRDSIEKYVLLLIINRHLLLINANEALCIKTLEDWLQDDNLERLIISIYKLESILTIFLLLIFKFREVLMSLWID